MKESYYLIAFTYEGIHYEGRVTPDEKVHHSKTYSYHVVLNEVFFGYLSKNNDHWHVTEQRPAGLVQIVGREIEKTGHEFYDITT
ncbi:MAG: hypothetical protein ABJB86_01160 [Bacteroidota bacterium]